ncbi:MAG: (R)-phenyllactyl-CoA dehydratase alpha subunit [Syntrophus sp. SKADARSKE-3]|nr:(R)-phenyllactyl-CoA dehydratase alpha subunit [Syntrophus sp. SKADARSKE-3]
MEEREQTKTTAVKGTDTARLIRGLVKNIYKSAHEAKAAGKKVAYFMVASQYDEIVRAMDIVPLPTENYAGLCAAKRDMDRFLLKAEEDGYSQVLCSYARIGLGFDSLRKELGRIPDNSPDGGMPVPDMMLGSSAVCDPRFKWFQAAGRYLQVPTFSIDIVAPPYDADLDEVRPYYIRYQKEQFEGLIAFLEQQTGRKMDKERLWETIRLSDKAWQLWYDIDRLRTAVPCPMPAQDHFSIMVAGHYYSGTAVAVDFYQGLYDEVKYKVANKIGAIADEKYRILYGGGLPPWHTLWIFNYFESFGAVFVIENVYRIYDPVEVPSHVKDPVEYLAWRTFLRHTQRHAKAQAHSGNPVVERLLEMIGDYRIDGVVFHACRSCRATTIGQVHLKDLLGHYTDIPMMQLVSDMVDLRDYSEAQWKSQIGAFIEALAARAK